MLMQVLTLHILVAGYLLKFEKGDGGIIYEI